MLSTGNGLYTSTENKYNIQYYSNDWGEPLFYVVYLLFFQLYIYVCMYVEGERT